MRWHIQGSDISDGNSVVLDVEAPSAVDAVTQAHDRNIIVASVVHSGRWIRKALPAVFFLASVALGITVVMLRTQLVKVRQSSAETRQDTQRVQAALQTARDDSDALRGRVKFLEGSLTDRERQREQSMANLTARLAVADDAVHTAQTAAAALDRSNKSAAGRAAQLTKQIDTLQHDLTVAETARRSFEAAAAADRAGREHTQKDLSQAIGRAAEAESRAAALDARLADLAAQTRAAEDSMAQLKSQLTETKTVDAPAPRYSLAIGYDQALDFATLYLGKPTVEAARGQFIVTALEPLQANTFTMHTDKEHVYDASLQVCLAADAPKEVLAANRAALNKYLATFAPQWKSPDAWLAAAFKNTANKGENDRSVLLTDYYRITVTGNKSSQFTVRIDPAQVDEK